MNSMTSTTPLESTRVDPKPEERDESPLKKWMKIKRQNYCEDAGQSVNVKGKGMGKENSYHVPVAGGKKRPMSTYAP